VLTEETLENVTTAFEEILSIRKAAQKLQLSYGTVYKATKKLQMHP